MEGRVVEFGRQWAVRAAAVAVLTGSLLVGAGPAAAGLLAQVEPTWSPFYRSPAPADVANLAAESRELLSSNPARVLQILARARPREGAAGRLLQGLRADAAYQQGGEPLRDALRLYRNLAATSPDPAERAWAWFASGAIQQGLGLTHEAETGYGRALDLAARDLYGIDGVNRQTIGPLNEAFVAARE